MPHPDCSCCTSYPCERTPDIFNTCWGFSLAKGVRPIPQMDWRPDFSKCTAEDFRKMNEADARFGLPDSLARWEERMGSGLTDSVYRSNEYEL